MLYLEDYLEIIENLPHELRDRFTLMRELDLQVHNEKDKLDARVTEFFSHRTSELPEDIREKEFLLLKQDYNKTLEYAEEKIMLTNQLYDLVDKYLRRLDHELHKFKIELEADNAGITEILEKRSLELDNASSSNYIREKRKSSTLFPTGTGKYNSNEKAPHNQTLNGFNVAMNNLSSSKQQNKNTSNNSSTPLSFENNNCLSFLNNKLSSEKSGNLNSRMNLSGPSAIAAAASQAIVATQQLSFGRRTASLKASYEAINSVLPNFYNLNQIRLDETDMSTNNPNSSNRNANGIQEDQSEKSKKSRLKRSRTSSQYNNLDISNNSSNATSSDTVNTEYNINEPLYCYCNNVSYGEMIFCENKQCPYQWFHYDCVGIKVPPEGSWFCPTCLKEKKKKESLCI